jgi:hypothetical protein
VEAILRDSLNKVASKIMEGKDDNSNGLRIYVATKTIKRQKVMLKDNKISRSTGGSGITINTRMPTIATASKTSLFFIKVGSRSDLWL